MLIDKLFLSDNLKKMHLLLNISKNNSEILFYPCTSSCHVICKQILNLHGDYKVFEAKKVYILEITQLKN